MSQAIIEETCTCGATYRIDSWSPNALNGVQEWRMNHRHEVPDADAETERLVKLGRAVEVLDQKALSHPSYHPSWNTCLDAIEREAGEKL